MGGGEAVCAHVHAAPPGLLVVAVHLDMHNWDNTTRSVVDGIDFYVSQQLHAEDGATVKDSTDTMREVEFDRAGGTGSWNNYTYTMWKFLFDRHYV